MLEIIYQYPIHLGVHVFHALATALPNKKADTDWLHYWGGKYSLTRKLSFYYNPVMKSWIFVKGPKKLQLWRYNFKEAGRNDLRRESWYGWYHQMDNGYSRQPELEVKWKRRFKIWLFRTIFCVNRVSWTDFSVCKRCNFYTIFNQSHRQNNWKKTVPQQTWYYHMHHMQRLCKKNTE